MAAPENIKAGFLKERDVFAERGIKYISPFVSLAEPPIVPKQLHRALEDAIPGLTLVEFEARLPRVTRRSRHSTSRCRTRAARSCDG
jgi:hypothetical protein